MQAQQETGGLLLEKGWESECGMDNIQDALNEESEKGWVGRSMPAGGEEEHARRWWREKYLCRRMEKHANWEKHTIRSEEDDDSEQRVPIRPRFLGCGPPSFREGATFRKPSTLHLHSSPSSSFLRPRTTIPNRLVKSAGSTPSNSVIHWTNSMPSLILSSSNKPVTVSGPPRARQILNSLYPSDHQGRRPFSISPMRKNSLAHVRSLRFKSTRPNPYPAFEKKIVLAGSPHDPLFYRMPPGRSTLSGVRRTTPANKKSPLGATISPTRGMEVDETDAHADVDAEAEAEAEIWGAVGATGGGDQEMVDGDGMGM